MKQAKHVLTKWDRRYFVLKAGRIAYFRREGDLEERGSFDLARHCRVEPIEEITVIKHREVSMKTMYTVKICYVSCSQSKKQQSSHNVLFAAATRELAEMWCDSIAEVIQCDRDEVDDQVKTLVHDDTLVFCFLE
jgi:hypothetical protein